MNAHAHTHTQGVRQNTLKTQTHTKHHQPHNNTSHRETHVQSGVGLNVTPRVSDIDGWMTHGLQEYTERTLTSKMGLDECVRDGVENLKWDADECKNSCEHSKILEMRFQMQGE